MIDQQLTILVVITKGKYASCHSILEWGAFVSNHSLFNEKIFKLEEIQYTTKIFGDQKLILPNKLDYIKIKFFTKIIYEALNENKLKLNRWQHGIVTLLNFTDKDKLIALYWH
jgi:hypothetical protein